MAYDVNVANRYAITVFGDSTLARMIQLRRVAGVLHRETFTLASLLITGKKLSFGGKEFAGGVDDLIEYRLPIAPARLRGGRSRLGRGITVSVVLHLVGILVALLMVHTDRLPEPKETVLDLVLAAPPKPAPLPLAPPTAEPLPLAPPTIESPPSPAPESAAPAPMETTAPPPEPVPAKLSPFPLPAVVSKPQPTAQPRAAAVPPRRPASPEPRAMTAEPAPRPPTGPPPSAASPPSPPAPSAPPAQTVQVSPAWRASVISWLMEHKSYPALALRRRQQGTVELRVTVDHDGRVQDVTLVHSSGSETLDQAAQTLLANAHLPPFPPQMALPQQTLELPIQYQLE